MVKGLDNFRDYFKEFSDRYVIIGGTACSLWMESIGLPFRATKDIDMVLVIEALDKNFVRKFWDYIRAGGYEIKERDDGKKIFYRFSKPMESGFPFMMEIFSGKPDILDIPPDQHLVPVLKEEGIASLSAILLQEEYYRMIKSAAIIVNNVSIANGLGLIPLKAKAFLDLAEREAQGERIDGSDISKHKKDVYRLYFSSTGSDSFELPESIKSDMSAFLSKIESDQTSLNSVCRQIGVPPVNMSEIIDAFGKIYSLDR